MPRSIADAALDYEEAWFAQPTAFITRIRGWIESTGLPLKIALTEVLG